MILYEGGEDVPLREVNSSSVFATGKAFPTKEWGVITIVAQEIKYYLKSNGAKSYRYFIVQFKDGAKVQTWGTNIRKGLVRNPNQPSVYHVGFMGQGGHTSSKDGKTTAEYQVWLSMLARCYSEKEQKRNKGVYNDCAVDKRWHNFQNFCKDLPSLTGYGEWLISVVQGKKYDLDKDIKFKGNKIYSKDTCQFVPHAINLGRYNKRQPVTGLTYIATRLSDGYEEEFTNQTEFSEKHNILHPSYVCQHILGKQSPLTDWKIVVKEET
jgi:hypothetical protein